LNPKILVVLPYYLFHVEKRISFSRDVGGRWSMAGSDEDQGKSRRLGANDRGWSSTGRVLGGRTIQRSCNAMCGLHHAQGDEERVFLDSASKPRSTVSPGLTSKPLARVS
jgi:hypothetical protein